MDWLFAVLVTALLVALAKHTETDARTRERLATLEEKMKKLARDDK